MRNNLLHLKKKFNEIQKMEWIPSMRDGSTGIGYTFEKLIGKEEDLFGIPDFEGIEIKAKHAYSKQFITLFNANPDGDFLFNIEKIQKEYGYPDKIIKNTNVFQGSIWSNKKDYIGINHMFELKVDYKSEKILLKIYDKKGILIDQTISWSFDLIKEKIFNKIKDLAIIKADSKIINGKEYFKYNRINFYKLKNVDAFIDLIDKGIIRITFKIGVFRDTKRYGNIHNHGTGFDINEKDLLLLYDEIYCD